MELMKYTAGFVITLILAGCGNSSGNDNATLVIDTTIGPAPVAPVSDTNKINTAGLTPTAVPAVPAVTGNTLLNPAHGQPGHRCEIAVGAPLDSKPVSSPAIPATQTVTPAAPANNQGINITMPSARQEKTAPASPTAAGLNPAHGQPGHRCEIAVGAPLDSKPAEQPAVTQSLPLVPSDAIKATPVVTPAAPVKNETVTAVAPGMNPAHGQPGHRCDIAVGAPLNSKPEPAKK